MHSVATREDRLTPLPENVRSLHVASRAWNGIRVDITTSHGTGRVAHHLCYETETRVMALLEEVGRPCEPRLHESTPCAVPYTPRPLQIVPAGIDLWGFTSAGRTVRY